MEKSKTGHIKVRASQCKACKKSFKPHPRLGWRQKTCGDQKCRLVHRASYRRNYRRRNREAEEDCVSKQREARGAGYWRKYRQSHPESTARNRANSRLRKKLKKAGLQRQLDIVQLVDPIEKLGVVVGFATSHRSLLVECLDRKCG